MSGGLTAARNVLAVVPPHMGGRSTGAALADLVPGTHVTVVESADEDPAALREAHAIITALAPVTAGHITAAPALELVQCASHGYDYVDLDAARARSVTVCNIGSSGAEAKNVAEQTFALMLALAKQVVPAHNALAEADWALPRLQQSLTELSGKTLASSASATSGRKSPAAPWCSACASSAPAGTGPPPTPSPGWATPATSPSTNSSAPRTTPASTHRSPRTPATSSTPGGWRSCGRPPFSSTPHEGRSSTRTRSPAR